MKLVIIKLGALGDVVRTLPLAKALKQKYPEAELTWITNPNAITILENNPHIDKIYSSNEEISETFDKLYNFDIDDEATNLSSNIESKEKFGFYNSDGFVSAFNLGAEYYLNTLFDDELKKENKKTYQEMMFMVAEIPYNQEHETIYLTKEEIKYGKKFIQENKLFEKKIIGINIGASSRWPSKKLHEENLKELIKKLSKHENHIILLGGPNEVEYLETIHKEFQEFPNIIKNNPSNSLKEFTSIINICDELICGDTLALHLSIALKKPTIGLFFCTSHSEVEDYNLLKKIISPKFDEFFPEKMDQYDEELVKSISCEMILNSLNKPVKVANAMIKNGDKFLVIKRKDEEIHAGKWMFPGGVLEDNENFEEALKREIKEEVGLEINQIIKEISNYKYLRPDGKITLGKSYLVNTEDFNVETNGEVEDFKWVTLEEFEKLDSIEGLAEELLDTFE
ncbi:NUDIX domain-containing protein [Candidatus Pacearchaeota archaeon]|nr:NUDIX domain-containing protein [Candidatus Pacearchaeota archaeon]